MNINTNNKPVKPKHNIIVTIIRNGIHTFNGYIRGETTAGYFVSFDSPDDVSKEWFAKNSKTTSCKLV